MAIQLERKGDTADVTVHLTTRIDATGDVGDGKRIICLGARIEGGARELAYLKKQFDGSGDVLVAQRDDNQQRMLYTTKFNGRTDWPRVHADFDEMIAILSGLLSLLRYVTTRLRCDSLNWYGPDQTCGFIGPFPASIQVTVSTENFVTLADPKP